MKEGSGSSYVLLCLPQTPEHTVLLDRSVSGAAGWLLPLRLALGLGHTLPWGAGSAGVWDSLSTLMEDLWYYSIV